MYGIKAKYKGVAPIMMDRFYDQASIEKPATKKKKGIDLKIVELKLHKDKKGVFVPADNIKMMLVGNKIRPGAAKILGSFIEKGKGTQYTQIAKSLIWVVGPKDPLKIYIDPKRTTYDDIDERSFINAQGSRSMSYRPIINLPWSLSFTIQVVDDQIDESLVRQFFDVAGLRCGCCAYGPTFGRCMIAEWEVVK